MAKPPQSKITVKDILASETTPAVSIDGQSIFIFINAAFEAEYGWSSEELLGNPITMIIPPHMRDAHNSGFSRFLLSESPRILDQPIELPVFCKDGKEAKAELLITGEKSSGKWRFAATVTPLKPAQ